MADQGSSGPGGDPDDLAAAFVTDLRAALADYYATHGEDIAAGGGRALEDAQAGVQQTLVEELAQADEDPYGHDLAAYRVFSHPDVIWPGSDIVWYGAYDRATCALEAIYPFH